MFAQSKNTKIIRRPRAGRSLGLSDAGPPFEKMSAMLIFFERWIGMPMNSAMPVQALIYGVVYTADYIYNLAENISPQNMRRPEPVDALQQDV